LEYYFSLLNSFGNLQVEKEIGERRVISFHGVGLSVAPEISFSEVTAAYENPEEVGYT
jgi:glycerol-3-phosphate O-acyltransferase